MAARHAEDLVHFLGKEVVFVVGKLGVEVAFFEFGGVGLGELILVQLKGEEGFAHAGEGVEHPEVLVGVGFEGLFVSTGVELVKLLAELGDGELQAGEGEVGDAVGAGEFEEAVLGGAEFGQALALLEAVLVTAVVPVGEVLVVEVDALGGEVEPDGFVRGALVEEVVDDVLLFSGEVGDFAVAAGRGREGRRGDGGVELGGWTKGLSF